MSNYTKATNFTAKDSLTSGDPSKIVYGSELDTEYSAIATAITTKADTASPTFTGTVTRTAVAGDASHSGTETFNKPIILGSSTEVATANSIQLVGNPLIHIPSTGSFIFKAPATGAGADRFKVFAGDGVTGGVVGCDTSGAEATGGVKGNGTCNFTEVWENGTRLLTLIPGGTGQTWYNKGGSRSVGTTYTNSTGHPIEVCVGLSGYGGADTSIELKVGASPAEDPPTIVINLVGVGVSNTQRCFFASAIVPNGGTYRVNGPTFSYWTEFRHSA